MRFPRALVGASVVACVVSGISGVTATSALAAAVVTANYQMNEPVGSSVMTDSSGNGINGVIDPTGVQTGATFDGATGYNWVRRVPTDPPPSPERVIQVPDSINLEPGDQPFTIEMRYRTKEKFGNIIQKGQAQTPGGQWKIQNPGGIPSCLFKGSLGQVATGSVTPLNDEEWHTLTCVLTSSSVTMYVDGVFRNRKNGTAGVVDNNFPMTVGGKIDCDQIDVTCDYYSGQIDYVKFSRGDNQTPHAAFTSSCVASSCSFDASTSSDPDGSIVSYWWEFGDGSTGTGITAQHAYAAPGTYQVTMHVLDNGGVPDVRINTVVVSPPPNQPPTAGFVPSCNGLACTFDSSMSSDPDGTIASYAWTFGDGGTSTANNPAHTYAATGTYDVTLTVTDNRGGSDPATSTIDVVAGNVSPVADFSPSCTFLDCDFNSSASNDPDGNIASYAWTFGGGGTATLANPSHSFAAAGSYQVTLTVTDNQTATDSVTKTVTVAAKPIESTVGFVGSRVSAASNNNPTVTVPATAAGQRLVMVLSTNNTTRTISAPTGVTGWTMLDTAVAETMNTTAWTKVAVAGDVGTAVHVPLSGVAKYTLTVAAYSGVDTSAPLAFARSSDPTNNDTARVTPDVTAPAGAWVASYWADKSSATTAWTPAASVTTRGAVCGADAGRICSTLADSGAALPAGTYGHITASTNAPSDTAVMWSFVLASTGQAPGNVSPVADFSSSCTFLDCAFNSSASNDPDGNIASYAWTFGGGGTSTAANPSHSFAAAGSFPVTLTVTDNEGAPGTITKTVTVTAQPVNSTVAFVAARVSAASNNNPTVTVPATAAGQRLVMVLSMNNPDRTIAAPTGVTGWTTLDTVTAKTMSTRVWTKVAAAGDVGTAVHTPLSGAAKYTLTVAAYSGVAATPALAFARSTDLTNGHTARATPAVTASAGSWVVSYWADKSAATTTWALPGSVTGRSAACDADAGRICSSLADSAGPVSAGSYGNLTATTNAPSDMATMWSIVLSPAP